MRMANGKLPKVWLLDPSGLPVHMSEAENINNGVTYRMPDGEGGTVSLIQPKAAKKGWCFMKDKCSPEEWAKWSAWSDKADAMGGRMDPPPMEERPACIRKVKAGAPPAPKPAAKSKAKTDEAED
jgi:hypothetical protein